MTRYNSPDEILQEYQIRLGCEFGLFYFRLRNQTIHVHAKWHEYTNLYGYSPERIEILNNCAPYFFALLDSIFWSDILLHLSRLTDPPGKGSKSNFTIRRLPAFIQARDLECKVTPMVHEAVHSVDTAREWRNRHLAHLDLDLTLGTARAAPLPDLSRKTIEDALSALRKPLDAVELYYFDRTVTLQYLVTDSGSDALVTLLQTALDPHVSSPPDTP